MKVADLHHLHARKRVRQPGKFDGCFDQFEFMPGDFAGVKHQAGGRSGSQAKKVSPCDQFVCE
jgi:hypothetical protein